MSFTPYHDKDCAYTTPNQTPYPLTTDKTGGWVAPNVPVNPPCCEMPQQRNFDLENLVWGMQTIIAPLLAAMKVDEDLMAGANGCYMLNVGTVWTGNAKALVVNSDCFFTTIKQNGVSVLTSKGFDGGVKAGGYITPDATKTFTDLTLTSGQVLIYF